MNQLTLLMAKNKILKYQSELGLYTQILVSKLDTIIMLLFMWMLFSFLFFCFSRLLLSCKAAKLPQTIRRQSCKFCLGIKSQKVEGFLLHWYKSLQEMMSLNIGEMRSLSFLKLKGRWSTLLNCWKAKSWGMFCWFPEDESTEYRVSLFQKWRFPLLDRLAYRLPGCRKGSMRWRPHHHD